MGQLSNQQCKDRAPFQIRLEEISACPFCNGVRHKHGHEVTYRVGQIVTAVSLDPRSHEAGGPFPNYCESLSAWAWGAYAWSVGDLRYWQARQVPPAYDPRHAPPGPPQG